MDYNNGLEKAMAIMDDLFSKAIEKCDKAKAEYDMYKNTDRYKAYLADSDRAMAIGEMNAIHEAKTLLLEERFNRRAG